MAIVAKTEPGTNMHIEGQPFDFGKDGKRQVTEAERATLEEYMASIGNPKLIEFSEITTKEKE